MAKQELIFRWHGYTSMESDMTQGETSISTAADSLLAPVASIIPTATHGETEDWHGRSSEAKRSRFRDRGTRHVQTSGGWNPDDV